MKRMLLGSLAAILVFGVVTLLALEGGEVVVLRTGIGRDGPHETRTWIADADGSAWIEAANPERTFYHDLAVQPVIELRRGNRELRCRATPLANPDGHQIIRRLLAAKYGWKDAWIGLVADTSQSLAVRLDECG